MGHRISPARVFLLVALFFLALTGTASAYQFSFAAPIPRQQQVQRAISFQLNRQVAKHWVVDPVSFTVTGGIPIYVVADAHQPCGYTTPALEAQPIAGCHDPQGIYVQRGRLAQETYRISHEMIEAEVDPQGQAQIAGWGGPNGVGSVEPCDPVDGFDYTLLGVHVADFVYPRWFAGNPRGPWDRLSVQTHTANPSGGAFSVS